MNKKAAELSLTVVIVAVILIIVLVVVVVIFGSKLNIFGKTTVNCQTQGGYCTEGETSLIGGQSLRVCPEGETEIRNTDCKDSGMICCIPILK